MRSMYYEMHANSDNQGYYFNVVLPLWPGETLRRLKLDIVLPQFNISSLGNAVLQDFAIQSTVPNIETTGDISTPASISLTSTMDDVLAFSQTNPMILSANIINNTVIDGLTVQLENSVQASSTQTMLIVEAAPSENAPSALSGGNYLLNGVRITDKNLHFDWLLNMDIPQDATNNTIMLHVFVDGQNTGDQLVLLFNAIAE